MLEDKHEQALKELYRKHGVGETITHKLAFWESQHPHGYCISHNPNDQTRVAVLELSWLVDNYPADFPSC